MRVCIVAEHASYKFGGEATLPLHYFSRLRARGIDAWLVVHSRTREELEALFPSDRHRIRFVEDAWFHKLLHRASRLLPRRLGEVSIELLSQLITQHLERKIVIELIRQEGIDVVHQPIPVSPRFPSLITNLGVPVVIGPMNGGMEYPEQLRHTESILSRAGVAVGRRLSGFVNSIFRGKRTAKFLLVANERTRLALPTRFHGEVLELPENGVDFGTWTAGVNTDVAAFSEGSIARFVFIGRLVDWKGVDMAIEALAQVPEAELEIIGDGAMRKELENFAKMHAVSERVSFAGWLPQRECAARLQRSTALILPSIFECGGAVVLEAMAMGKPVVAVAWGGPADYLGGDCGLLVAPSSRTEIVHGLTDSLRALVHNPELGRRLGANGRKRALQSFDWEKKVDRILEIYTRASGVPLKSSSKLYSSAAD